jgi:hypothetical protein
VIRPDGYPTGFKIAFLCPALHNSIFLTSSSSFFLSFFFFFLLAFSCGFVRFSHEFSSYFVLFCPFLHFLSILGTLVFLLCSFQFLLTVRILGFIVEYFC